MPQEHCWTGCRCSRDLTGTRNPALLRFQTSQTGWNHPMGLTDRERLTGLVLQTAQEILLPRAHRMDQEILLPRKALRGREVPAWD